MNIYPIRVLLVEDDEDDYILTRDLLDEVERVRFSLEWVATYDAALEAIAQTRHDVYLVDYRLGDRNGLELLREAVAKGCKAPIILLTGQGDREIDVEAMKAGAADYLDKGHIGAPLLEHSIRYAIERKQAEQKIREQAALLDVATDAIFVQDRDNKILFWNKGAERLYGWKATDALGKNAVQLLYSKILPTKEDFGASFVNSNSNLSSDRFPPTDIQKTLAEKGEWQGELHQFNRDGKEVIVSSRWTLVRDEQAQAKSILVVNTDITSSKQLEAQFLRAQRLESIGTLAGGIAHDLNNVLTPIMMAIQLLEAQVTDERSLRLLPILKNNTKRGAALVKQVLSFARGIEGERTVLQVRHLISEIKQIAKQTFPKSLEFYTDIPQDLWTVSGDATQLHQVLMNLCVNARDAMPVGGTISICAENLIVDQNYARMNIEAKVGAYIVLTVSDTGTGMPKDILDRIFEPFFTTKEIGKGTGLGLSTVLGIVKSHGGFIKVTSDVGRGTQFKVYLPAVEATETQYREDLELPKGNGELVLVVDDEVAICEVTKTSLETYGYRVLTASDGIEAIATYAQKKSDISVVLLDMMMPSMDGATTIRTLQKINPYVKIIAISGITANEKIAKNAGSTVKTFLSKPYTSKKLLKTINLVLTEN
ncbi:response regulator [Microcoleus sp. FACHB-831]|uniref:hybrid sensor histidine kinase/response regulator n=1 Tax=Microcoleus sp. FACHB-831 TaxID=2692827 RepID=UPI001684EECA|nr:hybrid sensor histidine kinase/response regulator [Microcoleus sp. FACHB-831]MBD1920102.1 response regulator [Microcoleus sp. FACHB-831]